VPGGADVDRHVVHRHDVRGAPDLVPVAELEGEVVQLALGALQDGDLVDLVVVAVIHVAMKCASSSSRSVWTRSVGK
jgi:hypothetical protein